MSGKIRYSFFESKHLLLALSVFLALILWFFVTGDNRDDLGLEVRRTFSGIPLAMRNTGTDLVVMETVADVTLSLQGMLPAFEGLTPADLEAYVDLNGRAEGWHEIRIKAAVPPGISVVRIEPATANILLEDLISRQVGVEGVFHGEPAGGLIVHGSNISPADVFVQGPRHAVGLLEKVVFELELDGVTGNFVAQQVPLHPVDKEMNKIKGLSVVPDRAEVWVQLGMPRREMPVKAVFTPGGAEPASFVLEPAFVELQGPRDLLDAQKYVYTDAIDLGAPDIGINTQNITVSLVIPAGLEAVNHTSVRVTFNMGE